MKSNQQIQAEKLKEQGNDCMKAKNFAEAIIHYTHGNKLDPKNHAILSNRSLAFLKMEQFYYAMEDAKETIKVNPDWPKGYFRRGEVEFAIKNYSAAIFSYKQALLKDPNDSALPEAISKANKEWKKLRKTEDRIPYIGLAIGLVLGMLVAVCDEIVPQVPSFSIYLKVPFVCVFVLMGYGFARVYKNILATQREGLLDPPIDLLAELNPSEVNNAQNGNSPPSGKSHSSAAAARKRYRKGKS